MLEDAADGALQLLGDHNGHAVDAADQASGVGNHGDGVLSGNGVLVIQELTLQTAADQLGVAHLKQDVALAQSDLGRILHVAADALHFVQRVAGSHEGEGAAVDAVHALAADGQTETVHGHHGQALFVDLKQSAGVNGAALVGGHGKGHLVDHGAQLLLLQGDGKLILHEGQLGIVRSGQTQNLEIGIAAAEMNHQAVICGEGHHIVGHTANDVAEQAGVKHDIAALDHVRGHLGADAGLHVVTGHGQLPVHVDQQAFQSGDGTLLGDSPAGHGDGALQQDFLAAKFNHGKLPLCIAFAFKKEKK